MSDDQLPPKTIDEPKQTTNGTPKAPKPPENTEPKVPIVPAPVKTNGEKPPDHCRVTCQIEKDWWDKAERFAAIAGIVLLAIYTGYTVKMYRANKKAADAAKRSADTAAKQEAFLEVSQRPWVEVTNPSISQQQTIPPTVPIAPYQPMLQGAPYEFVVTVKVYGTTPALRSYSKMNPRIVSTPGVLYYPFVAGIVPPPLDSCSQTAEWENGTSTYFPNGSYPLGNSQITSLEDMKKLIHAKEALFWIGCVRYEDAFKRRYQTNFCFYWSTIDHPLGWRRCLTGNDLIEYPKMQ